MGRRRGREKNKKISGERGDVYSGHQSIWSVEKQFIFVMYYSFFIGSDSFAIVERGGVGGRLFGTLEHMAFTKAD